MSGQKRASVQKVAVRHLKRAKGNGWQKHLPKDMLSSFASIQQKLENASDDYSRLIKNIDRQLDEAYRKKEKREAEIIKNNPPVATMKHWDKADVFMEDSLWLDLTEAVSFLEHVWQLKKDGVFGSTGNYFSRIQTEFESLAKGEY